MPSITFIHADGARENFDIPVGTTIMHGALSAGLDGIVGECGGSAMCATCHVYIANEEQAKRALPPVSAVEDAMLDSAAAERTVESRLGCQLSVTDAFDGLEIKLPERQL
ncbi:MAG: ferredoxin [Afipia sp. 62-7]|nr:2Fe-2S iron-sulfur cluster binding domain-containing protein [Alphaproteobacteria bacterium]OJU19931.1 MAG: ferredoxin [Afipia sp. 62-7]